MILLDTHIWIWWIHGSTSLSPNLRRLLEQNEDSGLGISIISCWEVAKLYQNKRLELPLELSSWIDIGLNYPGIKLIPITPEIAVESTQLPGSFHKDPADQLLVATSRVLNIPILTADSKIINYEHVRKVK